MRNSAADAAEIARLTLLANQVINGTKTAAQFTQVSTSPAATITTAAPLNTIVTTTTSRWRIPSVTPSVVQGGGALNPSKKLRLSEVLLQKDWPEGYDAAWIDVIGNMKEINKMKDKEVRLNSSEKRNQPGVRPGSDLSGVVPVTDLPAGQHNSMDFLYPTRFLPPIMLDMADWFDKELTKLPIV